MGCTAQPTAAHAMLRACCQRCQYWWQLAATSMQIACLDGTGCCSLYITRPIWSTQQSVYPDSAGDDDMFTMFQQCAHSISCSAQLSPAINHLSTPASYSHPHLSGASGSPPRMSGPEHPIAQRRQPHRHRRSRLNSVRRTQHVVFFCTLLPRYVCLRAACTRCNAAQHTLSSILCLAQPAARRQAPLCGETSASPSRQGLLRARPRVYSHPQSHIRTQRTR